MSTRYSFLLSSRWLKYIAMTIVVVLACVCLALWQKDRRDQRQQEIDTINANYSAEPVAIDAVLPDTSAELDASQEWTQVELTGRYQSADTVLARNRTVNDQTGFYVVTPFTLDNGATIALVRGWIADEESVPAPPAGPQTVIARVRPAQDGSEDVNPEGMIKAIDPARIPDMGDAYAHVYAEVADTSNGLPESSGLTPLPAPHLDPGNHLSYMLQWFAFGIMIIIAVSISARRERRAAAEAAERAEPTDEYMVVDKAALAAGAKVGQSGGRYGRNRFSAPTVHGQAEAEEDAMLEERFRSN